MILHNAVHFLLLFIGFFFSFCLWKKMIKKRNMCCACNVPHLICSGFIFALKCFTKTPNEWLFNICLSYRLFSLVIFFTCIFNVFRVPISFHYRFAYLVVIVGDDEDDLDGEDDAVEHDIVCECDIDDDSPPPWTFYGDGDEDIECDDDIDDQEDTALLRTSTANTEIVITPMSPVRSK